MTDNLSIATDGYINPADSEKTAADAALNQAITRQNAKEKARVSNAAAGLRDAVTSTGPNDAGVASK